MSARAYCSTCFRIQLLVNGRCGVCFPAPVGQPEPEPALSLFDRPLQVPAQKRPTSEAAAVEMSKAVAGKRRDVLLFVCETAHGRTFGMTDNEIIAGLVARGWSANTPRARRVELERGGWLVEHGTRDGSTKWRPTAKALEWWARYTAENGAAA